MLNKAILGFVEEEDIPDKARRNCPKHTERGCIVHFAGLTWHSPPDETRVRIWDFASAARTLRSTSSPRKCKSIDDYGFHDEEYISTPCFHQNCLNLLHSLQTKAWSEIRGNVFCALGKTLPAELIDRIFEYALAAGDIPQNPAVNLISPYPGGRSLRTNEEYLCEWLYGRNQHFWRVERLDKIKLGQRIHRYMKSMRPDWKYLLDRAYRERYQVCLMKKNTCGSQSKGDVSSPTMELGRPIISSAADIHHLKI